MKQKSQKGLPARAQSETVRKATKLFVPTARTDAQEAAIDKAFDEADEVAKALAPGMAKKEAPLPTARPSQSTMRAALRGSNWTRTKSPR